METLSANTLFHFTNSIDNIENILVNEFCPRYSLENLSPIANNSSFEVAIPMVSFCDIPLSQIKNHIKYYGHYAIGLKKEWGIKRKINPVFYLYKDSATADYIKGIFDTLKHEKDKEISLQPTLLNSINLMQFIKPYEGKLWKNEKYIDESIRFYDEREWRYVPHLEGADGRTSILGKANFLDIKSRQKETEKLKDKKLSFEPNDIKYIIVEKEKEILPIVKKIRDIKGDKYSMKDIDILVTRIISMEQIKEDF